MKIGLIGTSCCGKSTLFEELKRKFKDYNFLAEIASQYTVEQRESFEFQRIIMKRQVDFEFEMGGNNFISDRTVIDNLAYCMWYDKYYNHSQSDIYYDVIRTFHSHMITKPYDIVVFIDDVFPLVNNGVRKIDAKQQYDIYKLMKHIAPMYCDHYGLTYLEVDGHTGQRVDQIMSLVKRMNGND